jgi:hypothetical protein
MAFHGDQALFCECKWQNELVKMDVVTALKRRGEIFNYLNKYYIIFSRSGFSENVLRECQEENIQLIDFKTMMKQ